MKKKLLKEKYQLDFCISKLWKTKRRIKKGGVYVVSS